jgi:hypothetical protein
MVLKVSKSVVGLTKPNRDPGPADDECFVRIKNVPEGVSASQVILLFSHIIKPLMAKMQKYEFDFQELCPSRVPIVR